MLIIGITGSPRGKNSATSRLVDKALEGARDAGSETEAIDIARLNITGCKGCLSCYRTSRCALEDDFNEVYDKMLAAQGIILGSPVYFNHVSGQMKTFIDRTSDCRHCLYFEGKYAIVVVTTGFTGLEETAGYLNDYLSMSGASVIGDVRARMTSVPENMESACRNAYFMGKDLCVAIRDKQAYPDQEAGRKRFLSMFKHVVAAKKDEWPSEYEHYVSKGWIKEKM